MPSSTIIITIVIVILALGFDFINGFHDTANAIATSVATRVLTPRQAIIMSASLNLVGALISVKVATTVGANIIKPEFMPQIASAAAMAFNHGSNDAQKSMGIITMALVSGGLISDFHVYTWVKVCCAISMDLGTSIGGWRIIKTMGVSMGKLTPVNGFAAETSAAAIIFTATMLDAPVSTTQIISTSIMGVGHLKDFHL